MLAIAPFGSREGEGLRDIWPKVELNELMSAETESQRMKFVVIRRIVMDRILI